MPFFGGGIGGPEMLIVGIIALLLFGKRLPEVARSLGQGMGQFKKGLAGLQDEFHKASEPDPPKKTLTAAPAASGSSTGEPQDEWTAPRFEPPPEA